MAIGLSAAVRTSRMQAIIDACDAGAGPAVINFYNGVRPATGEAITTQTLLGTVTLSTPAGVATNGVLTFSSITDDVSVDADGTLRWARLLDGDGTFIADMTCGLAASGATVIFNSVDALAGGILKINSATFNDGNS